MSAAPTVTDATARPPLQLPDTVTITADEYEWMLACVDAGSRAAGLIDAWTALGFVSDTDALRDWRDARDRVHALADEMLGRTA